MIDVNVVLEGDIESATTSKSAQTASSKRQNRRKQQNRPFSHLEDCESDKTTKSVPTPAVRKPAFQTTYTSATSSKSKRRHRQRHQSQPPHHIGDAEVGSKTNFGAGTIIANFDGVNKYKPSSATKSASAQLCPSRPRHPRQQSNHRRRQRDYQNVEDNKLALARARQTVIEGWVRPEKGDKIRFGFLSFQTAFKTKRPSETQIRAVRIM